MWEVVLVIWVSLSDSRNFKANQAKYTGREKSKELQEVIGLTLMDKTLCVKGAQIAYMIWEVEGGIKKPGNGIRFLKRLKVHANKTTRVDDYNIRG
ncbi:hypothetical protein AgCh_008343 [Apium graveolens]